MDIYATSISSGSMILGTDGLYYGTVLATKHGLGTDVFVVRAVHRDDDLNMENVLCAYKVESNGDVKVFVDEPTSIRVTIGKCSMLASTSGTSGEVEELV